MCSIEEAWAGQTFEGKQVSSQGDIHKAYMSLPDNILGRNNEFSITNPNEPQSRDLTRGVNSKYSREPRVSNKVYNGNDASINFSSTMPTGSSYMGLEPRPAYMEIYDKNDPKPMLSRDGFDNIENAFNVSKTVDHFMQSGMNMGNMNNNSDPLLNEDTDEDVMYNNKLKNVNSNNSNNHSNFANVKQNKYNSSNSNDNDNIYMKPNLNNEAQVLLILQQIVSKLDKLEIDLHHHKARNMHDVILYILIGILLAFIMYSIYTSLIK